MEDPRLIDELSANAFAPLAVELVDGWRLRAAPDLPFRRANATVPFAGSDPPAREVTSRIERVEDFYRSRGLPPRFQLSQSAEPHDLDERLAARGYRVDSPVHVLVASVEGVLVAAPAPVSRSARVDASLDAGWIAAYANEDADPRDRATRVRLKAYARLLERIRLRSVAVTVDVDDQPGAVGLGVLERGWVGIFGMATRSDARRRGAARAVLCALASWARDEGAEGVYLQVEADNAGGHALYEAAGFVHNHSYHYRVLE